MFSANTLVRVLNNLPTETLVLSRDHTVVKAHAFHQCSPGSNPGPGVISGLILLLVFALFCDSWIFFPPQK